MLRCNFATEGDRLANNEAPHPPTMIEVVYDFVFAAMLAKAADLYQKDYGSDTARMAFTLFLHFQILFSQWSMTSCWMSRFDPGDVMTMLFLVLSMCGGAMMLLCFPPCVNYHQICSVLSDGDCDVSSSGCVGEFAASAYLRVLVALVYLRSASFATCSYHTSPDLTAVQTRRLCRVYAAMMLVLAAIYLAVAIAAITAHRYLTSLFISLVVFETVVWFSLSMACKKVLGYEFPRLHIGYMTARLGRFVSLSMSAIISSVIFNETGSFSEPWSMYVITALCPLLLFPLQLFYYDIQATRPHHALKAGGIRSELWLNLHSPLLMLLSLLSSSLRTYQSAYKTEADWTSRNSFGISLSLYSLNCVALYLCHRGIGKGRRQIRLWQRLVVWAVCSVVVMTLPLAPSSRLADTPLIFISSAIFIAQAMFEFVGKFPKSQRKFSTLQLPLVSEAETSLDDEDPMDADGRTGHLFTHF